MKQLLSIIRLPLYCTVYQWKLLEKLCSGERSPCISQESTRCAASVPWVCCMVCVVCELQNPSMSVFLNGLESSGWMRHIKSIIDASVFVAKVSDSLLCSVLSAYCLQGSECIHIGTSTSPGTRIRVPVNTSLHVFQWWPFTVTQFLYEYELPVNFTRTRSFLTGHVFIQPARCKRKICINLIYTCHDAHFMS